MNEFILSAHNVSVESLLHPEDENDFILEVSDESIVEKTVHQLISSLDEETELAQDFREYGFVDIVYDMSAKEKLKHLGIRKRILDAHGICLSNVHRTFIAAQHEMRSSHIDSLKQTHISEFFSK